MGDNLTITLEGHAVCQGIICLLYAMQARPNARKAIASLVPEWTMLDVNAGMPPLESLSLSSLVAYLNANTV